MKTKKLLYTVELIIEVPEDVNPDHLYLEGKNLRKKLGAMIVRDGKPVGATVTHIQTGTVWDIEEA